MVFEIILYIDSLHIVNGVGIYLSTFWNQFTSKSTSLFINVYKIFIQSNFSFDFYVRKKGYVK